MRTGRYRGNKVQTYVEDELHKLIYRRAEEKDMTISIYLRSLVVHDLIDNKVLSVEDAARFFANS